MADYRIRISGNSEVGLSRYEAEQIRNLLAQMGIAGICVIQKGRDDAGDYHETRLIEPKAIKLEVK